MATREVFVSFTYVREGLHKVSAAMSGRGKRRIEAWLQDFVIMADRMPNFVADYKHLQAVQVPEAQQEGLKKTLAVRKIWFDLFDIGRGNLTPADMDSRIASVIQTARENLPPSAAPAPQRPG